MERIEFHGGDAAVLNGMAWDVPHGSPRAVVQIAHGAAEHLGRYDRLARRLAAAGFGVLGADHRGHGTNAELHGRASFGPRGFAAVVEDVAHLSEFAQTRFGDLPLVLLGHSMGSFAAQAYLPSHLDRIAGLVLSGTAALDRIFAAGDPGASLSSVNSAFEPARTPFDWLSRDEAEVDAYLADPLCGFEIEAQSQISIAQTVLGATRDPRLARAVNVPILVITGDHDPIAGPDQAYARAVVEDYGAMGVRDIEHRIYAGGRHEMFNEVNREEVAGDLIGWLRAHFG